MIRGVEDEDSGPRRSLPLGLISAVLALAGPGGLLLATGFKHVHWLADLGLIVFFLLEFAALGAALIAAARIGGRRSPEEERVLLILGFGLSLVLLVAMIVPPRPNPRVETVKRLVCRTNLRTLGEAIRLYSSAHHAIFPTAEKWCDLLVANDEDLSDRVFCCPQRGDGRCHYAMNPNADRWSAPDVVLLFESSDGWNQAGSLELLTVGRHKGGCNILFVNGDVEFVGTEEIPNLKWEGNIFDVGKSDPPVPNARCPQTAEELDYWLRNMIWYHQFRTPEIRAATGLKAEAIYRAQEICGVYRAGQPERSRDAPLLVLAYPGGRHPRIGFLEGAIDPQRETKFSVFTPWDPNSYVVVDVPEAIWSNLGLTYLAHTHIDTIWTKQGIELPKLEWNRRPDGSLDIERKLPNGIAFGVKVVPGTDAVRMEMWIENGTEQKLSDLRVQNCVMPKMAAGFADQTNENKVLTNPYVACRSEDGRRWIITAWEGCNRPWGNEQCPCFHSDPKFPDLEPGERARLRGWLSFYEGPDIQGEFARIEATGWRK